MDNGGTLRCRRHRGHRGRLLTVSPPEDHAAGFPAVVRSMELLHGHVGVVRGAWTLLRTTQEHGFDRPGCAWMRGWAPAL
jgi:hypothetical protein